MPSRRGCLWTGPNTNMGREGPADPVGVCQEEGGQRTGAENPRGQAAGSGDSKSLAGAEPPRAALGKHTFPLRCRAMEDTWKGWLLSLSFSRCPMTSILPECTRGFPAHPQAGPSV